MFFRILYLVDDDNVEDMDVKSQLSLEANGENMRHSGRDLFLQRSPVVRTSQQQCTQNRITLIDAHPKFEVRGPA